MDDCIQNFHLRRYIIGYTVGNLVLRRRLSGAVNCDFRTYIQQYTSLNKKFEYGYLHSNAVLQFKLKLERSKPHKAARHPTKCDVIKHVKLFPTVYRRICCHKFLVLSNQTSCYKLMCIRIEAIWTIKLAMKVNHTYRVSLKHKGTREGVCWIFCPQHQVAIGVACDHVTR